ncbi:MAG: hypothetical protein N2422_02630 [Rhodobacteraceae bacterium]|nr:hypothetical protein [Paracoccaceae bacterium]
MTVTGGTRAEPGETGQPPGTRPLALWEALVPVVTLIVLIVASVLLFGDAGFEGPNQIALVLAAMTGVWVARRAGHSLEELNRAAVASISSGIGAILILFAVGALIGAWAVSGTLVAMVYYGLSWLSPSYFPLSAFLVCAAVATCLGSSWTTAGTLGVGFMGMAVNMGIDPALAAGAIIAGAYVGELVSPLSDTANLASGGGGVPLYTHLRAIALPTALGFLIAGAVFRLLSVPKSVDVSGALAVIGAEFHMTPWLFLPLAVVAGLALMRVAPFTTIILGALTGLLVAVVLDPGRLAAFADPAGALWGPVAVLKGAWQVLATGFRSDTGIGPLDTLLSRGGMESMLPTIWLIMAALGYGGVVERAGVLSRLIAPVVAAARSATRLVASIVGAVVGANMITADQYMAIVLPARMFRGAVAGLGYPPVMLTRTVAAAATPTSALVPWNSCGAYMAATLGVSTIHYAPYAVFNYVLPLVVIALAAIGPGRRAAGAAGNA